MAAPSVESDGVSQVGTDFLELNVSVSSFSGGSVDVGVEYRETGSGDWSRSSLETFTSTGVFQATASGLEEGTEYELRAYAEDEDGSDTGSILEANTTMLKTVLLGGEEVNTEAVAVPEVETVGATNVSTGGLTFEGDLVDVNGSSDVDVFFRYRELGDSSWNFTGFEDIEEERSFRHRVEGLDENTRYEFQSIAVHRFDVSRSYHERSDFGRVSDRNTTMLKTVPLGESSVFTSFTDIDICDVIGEDGVCVVISSHSIDGDFFSLSNGIEVRSSAQLSAVDSRAQLDVEDIALISGMWIGSFNISGKGDSPRIEPGAELHPDNGSIQVN